MGKLVRRTLDGDSIVAEWSAEDAESVRAAAEAMRREVDAGYVGDAAAARAATSRSTSCRRTPTVVILTMPMGGG